MMLSWVSMREPFPVVGDGAHEDMQTLRAKGAYKQYNAHYVPVVPKIVRPNSLQDLATAALAPTSNDPNCPYYFPCSVGEAPYCAEVVVFNESQTLPRFWIELCPEHPGIGNLSINPKLVEDLIPHIFKVLEHPEVDTDKKLRTLFAQELSKLLKANLDDDLTVPQETLFGMMKSLLDAAGKINKAARQALIGGGAAPAAAAAANIAPVLAPPVVPQQSSPAIPPVVPVALSPAKAPPVQPVILVPQAPAFQLPALAFGVRDWNRYFGDVGAEPPLPADINDFLESPCPIFPGKKIKDTHTLALVPATVNGKPLTLDSLGELIQRPQNGGNATKYAYYWESAKKQLGQTPAPASHWVLMTTDVLPNTRNKKYDAQVAEVSKYRDYEVPSILEAAVAILMGYVKTGIRWYSDSPWTYTRCQEKVDGYPLGLGGLGSSGLNVDYRNDGEYENYGVGALRQFRSLGIGA